MPRPIVWTMLLALLGLWACGAGGNSPTDLPPVPPASMFVEHLGPFCDASAQDRFSAGYYGTNPLDTLIYLYIVCHKVDTVYRTHFPAAWLTENDTTSDGVARVQAQMHALVQGKLAPSPDSTILAAAGGQQVFGMEIPGHFKRQLYFSAQNHRVVVVE
jgi:hypothetical protein